MLNYKLPKTSSSSGELKLDQEILWSTCFPGNAVGNNWAAQPPNCDLGKYAISI